MLTNTSLYAEKVSREMLISDSQKKHGDLIIFFGTCMGEGKTQAMLEKAYLHRQKGLDVVLGNFHPDSLSRRHAVMECILPNQSGEIDIEAILQRSPGLVIIDELAHNNSSGSRHKFRYQDIEELLDNGINVYTTLSVIQLESNSYMMSNRIGIKAPYIVPDIFFEQAAQIIPIDCKIEEIIRRYNSGEITTSFLTPEQETIFFSLDNLTLLKKSFKKLISFRKNESIRQRIEANKLEDISREGLRLLVHIDEKPKTERIIQRAKELSYTMGAPLFAVYVYTSDNLSNTEQDQLNKNIRLAYRLGAYVIRMTGDNWISEMSSVIKKEKITHLILEREPYKKWYQLRTPYPFEKLIKKCEDIDIYILSKESSIKRKRKIDTAIKRPNFTASLTNYVTSILITISFTILLYPLISWVHPQAVIYLCMIILAIQSLFFTTGPILTSAVVVALIIDYFFTPPFGTFTLYRINNLAMFGLFLSIPLINSIFANRLKRQELMSRKREQATNTLLHLSKHMAFVSGIEEVLKVADKAVKESFDLDCTIILKDQNDSLNKVPTFIQHLPINEEEYEVAKWVFSNRKSAGRSTETFMSEEKTFYPLNSVRMRMGVIAVKLKRPFSPHEELIWLTLKRQISNALEREYLNELATQTLLLQESDKLYKTLFNSISHELRIPVATILTASETLSSIGNNMIKEINNEIYTAGKRLHRLIEELLSMSRVDSGRLSPRCEYYDIQDLIGPVLQQMKIELSDYKLNIDIEEDTPLINMDLVLMQQILTNLLYNIINYVPKQSQINIKTHYENSLFSMEVSDNGPGFNEEDLPHIFDKFYRGAHVPTGGSGLGLAIVKGYAEAMKGTATACNTPGACITVTIPSEILIIKE